MRAPDATERAQRAGNGGETGWTWYTEGNQGMRENESMNERDPHRAFEAPSPLEWRTEALPPMRSKLSHARKFDATHILALLVHATGTLRERPEMSRNTGKRDATERPLLWMNGPWQRGSTNGVE
jgi:hypothetical protein